MHILKMYRTEVLRTIVLFRFRNKYHPDEALAYQKKLNYAVKKRAAVFVDLLQSGWFDRFTLTAEQGEEITKLLDAGWKVCYSFVSKMLCLHHV